MRKILLATLCSTVLLFGHFSTQALAASNESVTLEQLETIADQSPNVDIVSTEVLPEGTRIINFDTVEEFQAFVNDWDQWEESGSKDEVITDVFDPSESNDPDPTDDMSNPYPGKDSPTAKAKTYNGSSNIKWTPVSLNPVKSLIYPTSWWINFSYKYTGSGSNRKFSSITAITSDSSGFPSSWYQSTTSYNFYDYNKGVRIKIQGHHLLGVNVGGQSIGAKFSDSATKSKHF